jgi:hypothetical protein
MKVPSSDKVISIAMIIGLLVVVFIVYKLLSGIGLIKTPAKKRAAREQDAALDQLRGDEYWSPQYYKTATYKSMNGPIIMKLAGDLHDAMSGLATDEEVIFTTFNQLLNKANVSELAAGYQLKFGSDLQADLLNDLNKSEVATLMEIVNNLPNR